MQKIKVLYSENYPFENLRSSKKQQLSVTFSKLALVVWFMLETLETVSGGSEATGMVLLNG